MRIIWFPTALALYLAIGCSLEAAATNKLEQAVQAGPNVHKVNKSAAKPGDKPDDYGKPGRGHKKPKPPKPPKHG
jgi:hypothetical protein